jgi:hypothetical protein
MSSGYVRTLIEGWLNDAAMDVPYYPTANLEQNPTDDIWCTADFSSNFRDFMTYCDGMVIEEGEVEVRYLGLPGIGYSTLLAALEADMITLMAQRDPGGKCVLMSRSAPFESSGGTATLQYGLSVYMDYQYFE